MEYPFLSFAEISITFLSLLNDKEPTIPSSVSLKYNVSELMTVFVTYIDLKRLELEPRSIVASSLGII